MRFLFLLCVCALAIPSSAQTVDPLDPSGYFPLEVGHAWEYQIDLHRPFSGYRPVDESRTEFVQMEVVGNGAGPNADRFELATKWYSEDSVLLEADTLFVWFNEDGEDGRSTVDIDCTLTPCGPTPRLPFFFGWDLGADFGSEFGRSTDSVEVDLGAFFGSGGIVDGKQVYTFSWNFTAVHSLGIVGGGGGCEPCSSFSDSEGWTLTFAQIGSTTYGARVVANASAPDPPARLVANPNPARGWITVEGSGRQLDVLDVLGRRVELMTVSPTETIRLDVRAYPPGVYLLRRGSETTRVTVRQ